jgi:tRNA threonylcarbamoyladenosine biosynthesis protein TsaB
MRILGIETSGPACRVARLEAGGRPRTFAEVMRGARVAEREYSGDAARHSEALWSLLDAVGGVGGLDVIAVSLGPGSFTGLRVGLAAAKVFARFGGVALAGIPTLEAMAAEASPGGRAGWVVAAPDARRGEVYAAVFRCSRGVVRKVSGPRVCQPAEASRGAPPGTQVVAGQPRAAAVAALGALRFLAGVRDDPRTLVPVYVRRPAAVEKLRRARRVGGNTNSFPRQ